MLLRKSTKRARDLTANDNFEMAGHMLCVTSVETKPYNRYVTVHARHLEESEIGTSSVVNRDMLFTVYN